MTEAKHWTIDIHIDEHEDRTRATARLHNRDETGLIGVGLARLNPADVNVPQIGDETRCRPGTERVGAQAARIDSHRHRGHDSQAGQTDPLNGDRDGGGRFPRACQPTHPRRSTRMRGLVTTVHRSVTRGCWRVSRASARMSISDCPSTESFCQAGISRSDRTPLQHRTFVACPPGPR